MYLPFSLNCTVWSDFSVSEAKASFLLLLSVNHWTRYKIKSCTISNMINTHLFCVPLFGNDSSGWAFSLDERKWVISTSLYFKPELLQSEVNYNSVKLSFGFLFFHFMVTIYIVSFFPFFFLGLSVSLITVCSFVSDKFYYGIKTIINLPMIKIQ